jgi:RNA polymerase sigma-70 factor (ECF subfamily)
MATIPTSVLREDTRPCTPSQDPEICPELLSALYEANYRYVLRVCRRFFRQRADAEDAAAEVFLKVHRVLHKKDQAVPFRPWVLQVAGRHCIDMLRRGKLEKRSYVASIDVRAVLDDSTPSPLAQVLRRESHRQLREHLIRLPARYKVPLVLHYYKRMSYSEIARTLKRGLPAVKMMIFRAKHELRLNLGQLERTKTDLVPSQRRNGTEFVRNTSSLTWNRMNYDTEDAIRTGMPGGTA